jgi:hypothetical protein
MAMINVIIIAAALMAAGFAVYRFIPRTLSKRG